MDVGVPVERVAQALIIADDIMAIMEEYRRQEADGFVDTPGGLEHMGDVWNLLAGWDESLRAANLSTDANLVALRAALA
jgi:hypothetical protein